MDQVKIGVLSSLTVLRLDWKAIGQVQVPSFAGTICLGALVSFIYFKNEPQTVDFLVAKWVLAIISALAIRFGYLAGGPKRGPLVGIGMFVLICLVARVSLLTDMDTLLLLGAAFSFGLYERRAGAKVGPPSNQAKLAVAE